jgi:broad specificity phosphatase PhoE
MTTLLLVRHGESTWNAIGRWQGQADPPLSQLGELQAVAAALGLVAGADTVVHGTWASDLQRARRTAELLTAALGDAGRLGPTHDGAVAVDGRLRERDAGEWTGLTRPEIEDQWPGALAAGRRPPAFEPQAPFVARAMAALDAVAEAVAGAGTGAGGDRTALVVSHGGVVRAVEHHLGAAVEEAVPNLGGIRLHHDGHTLTVVERIQLVSGDLLTAPRQL